MSLTSLLKSGAVLKPWFEEHYPNVKFMQTAWRSAGPPTVLAPQGANPALVGTAFDYRLRLFLDPNPDVQSFVAHRGTLESSIRGPQTRSGSTWMGTGSGALVAGT